MEQSERDLLLKTLNVLRKSREYSVNLLMNDPYIHQACFKYRKSPAAMNLVMDRYYTDVLNSHFDYTQSEPENVKSNVARMVSFLIECELNTTNSKLGEFLLRKKKRILNEMLNTSDKEQERENRLLVANERDRARYEDEVERITKGEK